MYVGIYSYIIKFTRIDLKSTKTSFNTYNSDIAPDFVQQNLLYRRLIPNPTAISFPGIMCMILILQQISYASPVWFGLLEIYIRDLLFPWMHPSLTMWFIFWALLIMGWTDFPVEVIRTLIPPVSKNTSYIENIPLGIYTELSTTATEIGLNN